MYIELRNRDMELRTLYMNVCILLYLVFCTLRKYRDRRMSYHAYPYFEIGKTFRVLYSAQYHKQHCIPHAFEQFGALYAQPRWQISVPIGFEPGTSRLQAPVDTNEPSGPA